MRSNQSTASRKPAPAATNAFTARHDAAPMSALREHSERMLAGEELTAGLPVAPGHGERLDGDVLFVPSFANVSAIPTDDGLVLIDSGARELAAAGDLPLATHLARLAEQAGGDPSPEVYAARAEAEPSLMAKG